MAQKNKKVRLKGSSKLAIPSTQFSPTKYFLIQIFMLEEYLCLYMPCIKYILHIWTCALLGRNITISI